MTARTFAWPALIAVVTLVGLVTALAGDGPYDAVSWIALALPIAAAGWAWIARRT